MWTNLPDNYKEYYGFVYTIKNNINGREYIGKKSFWKSLRRKPLKGKKRIRLDKIESNWRSYWGSCDELQNDIKKHGESNFTKTVVSLHKTKWDLTYAELYLQVTKDVLFNDSYYNGIINIRLRKRLNKERFI